jgi:PPOX class probable F420-dependent enzyme
VTAQGTLDGGKYISLETFRRNGQGVRTPVWFAAEAGVTYVYTLAGSGKAKRIRRDGRVRIAPCDSRGRVAGAWTDARAAIAGPDDYRRGMALLNRKYWPWKQVLDFSVLFMRRHERVVLAIHPS